MSNNNSNKYNYNDCVEIVNIPNADRNKSVGHVCGFIQADDPKSATYYNCSEGSWVYLIEFPDGSSQEIAECYLKPCS